MIDSRVTAVCMGVAQMQKSLRLGRAAWSVQDTGYVQHTVSTKMAKHHSEEEKRSAIELRKAGVPLKKIRDQLKMTERTLRRILTNAANHPLFPVPKRKFGTGRKSTINQATLSTMRRHLSRDPNPHC